MFAALSLYWALGGTAGADTLGAEIERQAALGSDAVPWHLALWDPFWLLGGVLFLLAARAARPR